MTILLVGIPQNRDIAILITMGELTLAISKKETAARESINNGPPPQIERGLDDNRQKRLIG